MDLIVPLMTIIGTSYDLIAKRMRCVVNLSKRTQRLQDKLAELRRIKDDVQREMEQAESGGSVRSEQIKGWLERVDRVEGDISLLFPQPAEQEGKCWCSPRLCLRYKLSAKALKKEREMSDLMMKKEALVVYIADGIQKIDQIPDRSTVGLDQQLKTALECIADGVGILGIYGMGGVGKTTLLKRINNECLSKGLDFEAVIWITVSREFGIERIQTDLFSRLRLPWDESCSIEQRGLQICNKMRRMKFLLLLDDVWEGFNLEKVGIPPPDNRNKCSVLFTTRSMDVCTNLGATKKLRVSFLNHEHSWQLFCDKIGDTFIMNSLIKPFAEEIVKRCGGLPLALITVARAMANRRTKEEWKYAVEVLTNSPSELRGMEDIFSLLNLSYENLNDETLKICFLYCALFPVDYPLEKEQLIDYWIGEGFLDGANEGSIYNKGHTIIGSLRVAGLLESSEDETLVRLHDVVRSFALWIASNWGKSKDKLLLQGSPGIGIEKWGEAEKICLMDGQVIMLSGEPVCPILTTLLLKWNFSLREISDGFFQFMPALKVLDLSATNIREIPKSIGHLIELCHLDLSRTKITSLPRELGCLTKLRHLDLQRTYLLQSVPKQIILGLRKLRVLNLYCSYGEWEIPLGEDEGEATIQDLQHLNYLTSLGITVTEHSILKKLSVSHTLLDIVEQLYINGCQGLVYAILASVHGGGDRLRRLSIYNCNTLKEIDLGSEPAGKDWLPSLEVLVLHTLPNLTAIWRKSITENCHQNLHNISIWHCPKLKNLSWILHLQNLEKLYVFYCENIEEIVGEDEVEASVIEIQFTKLKVVSFRSLLKLTSLSKDTLSFPTLESIAVVDCPLLKKLPSKGYDASNKPVVYCCREWWDNLEWDHSTPSSSLHPQWTIDKNPPKV